MQGTRHEDTIDVSIHSAHSVDLLSCCIEHGLVDTAWTAVQAAHRRQHSLSYSWNMIVSLEFGLSSVSVVSDVFLLDLSEPLAVVFFCLVSHKPKVIDFT